MRTGDELRELAGLGFRELGAATGGIQGIHSAVAERAFRASAANMMEDAMRPRLRLAQVMTGPRERMRPLGGCQTFI